MGNTSTKNKTTEGNGTTIEKDCTLTKVSSHQHSTRELRQSSSLFEKLTVTQHPPEHNVWDFYSKVEHIAKGSTCEIHTVRRNMEAESATSASSSSIFVVKQITKELVRDEIIEEMRNEISILQKLDHPNVVRVYETFEDDCCIYLIMEYLEGGDLFSFKGYTERQAAKILTQICSAIAYCHKHGVVHRDLKLENVIFQTKDPDSDISVIDFGLSKNYVKGPGHKMTEKVGTMYTLSPQVLKGEYTEKADMWAIGVIAFILLSGVQPFTADTNKELAAKIYKGTYSMDGPEWQSVSSSAKNFVRSLLEYEPSARKSASEALRSVFLQKNYSLSDRKADDNVLKEIDTALRQSSFDSKFHKLAMMIISYRMPMKELRELRNVFDSIDTNNTGTIMYWELRNALKQFNHSDSEMKAIFKNLDQNQNGVINYSEFLAAVLESRGRVENSIIREAFDKLDVNHTGFIDKDELCYYVRSEQSVQGCEKIVNEIMEELDLDGDGKISYEEFKMMFKKREWMDSQATSGTS